MTSSSWRALGNTYVVVEPGDQRLDATAASALARGSDGVLEVLGSSDIDGLNRDTSRSTSFLNLFGERDREWIG